jgi:hypothetical protein
MKVPWDRGGLRSYLVLLALLLCGKHHTTLLWGLPLLVLGAALHVYEKGCLHQDQVVATGGPYRFVRHPFYTANLMIDESLALMSGCWPLIVLLPVWWFAVYLPVMRGEEAYLCSAFPDVYPAYQRRLPRLFPTRRPLPAEGEGFSFRNSNITDDSVIPRFLRIIAYPLVFFLAQEGWARNVFANPNALMAFAALVVLYGYAWLLKRHLKQKCRVLPDALRRLPARLALAAGMVLAAGLILRPEIESEVALAVVGVALLLLSLVVFLKSRRARLAAEGLVLAAVMVLCELPWLAALPLVLYGALYLDQRNADAEAAEGPAQEGGPIVPAPAGAYMFSVVAGLAATVAKELLVR